jgi:hypothetical protein
VSTIIDAANQVLGADASDNDIIGMTLRMAADVIDYGVRPSGLAEADPRFLPWHGSKDDLLDCLGREIGELVRPGARRHRLVQQNLTGTTLVPASRQLNRARLASCGRSVSRIWPAA